MNKKSGSYNISFIILVINSEDHPYKATELSVQRFEL